MNTPTPRAVILYGPPASGKSTITECLERLDKGFRLFPRLKTGPGRRTGYRMTTLAHIEVLRASGDVVWENERYGAVYVVDHGYLDGMLREGVIPVLHVGQRTAVNAIVAAFPDVRVTRVSLTCPRNVVAERVTARAMGDVAERLAVYDATKPLPVAELVLDTSLVEPAEAACLVAHECLQGDDPACD